MKVAVVIAGNYPEDQYIYAVYASLDAAVQDLIAEGFVEKDIAGHQGMAQTTQRATLHRRA